MNEEHQAVKGDEQNIATHSPSVEQNASGESQVSVQTEKTDKSTVANEPQDEKPVSGAERRIHKLVDERDQYRAKAQTLESKLAELTSAAPAQTGNYPNYQPSSGESQGGERELTIEDLRTIARLEVETERTKNRIIQEASEATKLNPELDRDSDQFDPEISQAVADAVELEILKNPSQSVKKLTEKYMRPYRKAAERAVGQEKKAIAAQVADEALRPVSVKPTSKSFSEKSIAEMEAELGIVH